MLRVNGFYGHVARNDLRSAAMFLGFLVAYQILAAAALCLPLLMFDIRHAPLFGTAGYVERYAPAVFAASIALFLVRFARHVASVRATVDFRYVDRRTDARFVDIVETQAIAAGLPLPRVGVIESPARNAFAYGLNARTAVVVATRGLLDALDDDELAAVAAHEVAHIRNGDIRLMAAANVLMGNLEALQRRNPLRIAGWTRTILAVLLPPFLMLCLASGFAVRCAFTLARVSRLLISSSREFVADAEAVRMTHNPAALVSALRRIEGRSAVAGVGPQADAMMIDGAVDGAFASHPTIAERVAVLTRLSGGMVHASPARRDTRTVEQRAASRGAGFGRRWAPDPGPATPTPRGLIGRVNAGSNENAFGLTPSTRRNLLVGFVLFLALLAVATFTSVARLTGLPEHRGPAVVETKNGVFIARASDQDAGSARVKGLQRLAATDPLGARCFATDAYRVGDRGLRRSSPPDPALVQAFSVGAGDGRSDISLERYLGNRLRSVRAVVDAGNADLDLTLAAYVNTRKILLQAVHRFFGEPGLRLMLEAYDSDDDRTVLAALRRRSTDSAPALAGDGRLAAEIALLVSAPADFVPCVARQG